MSTWTALVHVKDEPDAFLKPMLKRKASYALGEMDEEQVDELEMTPIPESVKPKQGRRRKKTSDYSSSNSHMPFMTLGGKPKARGRKCKALKAIAVGKKPIMGSTEKQQITVWPVHHQKLVHVCDAQVLGLPPRKKRKILSMTVVTPNSPIISPTPNIQVNYNTNSVTVGNAGLDISTNAQAQAPNITPHHTTDNSIPAEYIDKALETVKMSIRIEHPLELPLRERVLSSNLRHLQQLVRPMGRTS